MAEDDARAFALVEIGDLDAAGLEVFHARAAPSDRVAHT